MSRLPQLRQARPGLFARIVYFVARKKLGRVPEPVKVLHRNTALLAGVGALETAFDKSTRVSGRIKALAQVRVAMMVGCPF